MKRKIISVVVFFVIIILLFVAFFIGKINSNSNNEMFRKQMVELNEIQSVVNDLSSVESADDITELEKSVDQCQTILWETINRNEVNSKVIFILTLGIVCVIFVITVFLYIYIAILRPFNTMKDFADKIAKGNFDIPLKYERSNYFGAFTWAFDNMRKEVITARKNENEAVLNNKTVIATISHDIKTPITSIRAYSESLASNQGQNNEKNARYISVILRKCDEVTKLTNDLLLHSVSDLDKLKMEPAPESIKTLLIGALDDISVGKCHINFNNNAPDSVVMLDKQRFEQVIENLVSNSIKYAGTDIDVSCKIEDNDYIITIKDYGEGIPVENMPFIFGKFYRGANAGNMPGSGLGLYITEYIMKKHKGKIKLFNNKDGFEAVLCFPICKV